MVPKFFKAAEFRDFLAEGVPVDPQDLRGFGNVVTGLPQDLHHVLHLQLLDRVLVKNPGFDALANIVLEILAQGIFQFLHDVNLPPYDTIRKRDEV
jgi:hypothetical protein